VVSIVATLTLGSRPRQGFVRGRDKRETQEAHLILLGVQESVREWTFTLPRQLPLGELESWRTPESSGSDYKGQNPSVWKVFNIIGKLLKFKCLKWAHITHLDIWNTSYGQKKGWESNWQFDSRPLKFRNQPNFFTCRWHVTYNWKNYRWGPQLWFRPHRDRRFAHKVMGFQSRGSPNFSNFRTPTWESQDKKPFGCGPRGEA
jgi:hypothetical protein